MNPTDKQTVDSEASLGEVPTSRREIMRRLGLSAGSLAALSAIGQTNVNAEDAEVKPRRYDELSLQEQVMLRAAKDPAFRALLLKDPRKGIETVLGEKLPEGLEIQVLEEPAKKLILVLPAADDAPKAGKEPPRDDKASGPFHSRIWCCNHDLTCTRKTRPAG